MRSTVPARARRLSEDDYRVLASFRYALRRFLQFSERAAAQLGVTGQQYQALLAVRGFPGRARVTVGELAERMCIQHHSAVGLVDRLAERELVRRAASRGDRRHVFVELTARGEKVQGRAGCDPPGRTAADPARAVRDFRGRPQPSGLTAPRRVARSVSSS